MASSGGVQFGGLAREPAHLGATESEHPLPNKVLALRVIAGQSRRSQSTAGRLVPNKQSVVRLCGNNLMGAAWERLYEQPPARALI